MAEKAATPAIHVVSMTLTTSGLRGTLTSDRHLVGRIEFASTEAAEFYEAFIARLCRRDNTDSAVSP